MDDRQLIKADDGLCKFEIEADEKDVTSRDELGAAALALVTECLGGDEGRGHQGGYVGNIGQEKNIEVRLVKNEDFDIQCRSPTNLPVASCQTLRHRMPVTTKDQTFGPMFSAAEVDVLLPVSLFGDDGRCQLTLNTRSGKDTLDWITIYQAAATIEAMCLRRGKVGLVRHIDDNAEDWKTEYVPYLSGDIGNFAKPDQEQYQYHNLQCVYTGVGNRSLERRSHSSSKSYTLTSSYFSNRICVTESFTGGFISHAPLSLRGPIMTGSVVRSEFSIDAFNDMNGGYTTCHNGVTGRIKVQRAVSIPQPAESSSIPTATQSIGTHSASHATVGGGTNLIKILLGVLVSLGGVGCLLLLTFALLRYRKRRRRLAQDHLLSTNSDRDAQPYLQQKAELEDVGNRRFEMDGSHTAHEMQARGIAQEIATGGRRETLPSLSLRHELVGEEFVKELEGTA